MKTILLLTIILVASCGLDHKIEGKAIPDAITVQPNFAEVAAFCDERYGIKTIESEECFKDFRDYYKPEISVNLDSVAIFCEDNYEGQVEQERCQDEFLDILSRLGEI